jgi:DNA-binding NarL/FixJ family response regulator
MTDLNARLLLADDHRMFRQGLRELIERKTDYAVVGEASTGAEVLAQVEALRPDLVLLDIQMPDLDGVAVARQLAVSHPEVKLIMLTMYRQDQHVIDAIKAGVRAYLLKDADAEELIEVIGRVQRGESALDPSITARVFEEIRRGGGAQEAGEQLTPREREIVRLLADGCDNRTIAARLHLSEKTVGNRMSEIFQKLGVTNRTQAAMVAIQRGLIAPLP